MSFYTNGIDIDSGEREAAQAVIYERAAREQTYSSDQIKSSENKEEHESEEVDVAKKEQKGPVIICVDTSGSMQGTPENIAKTVTFALSKIAYPAFIFC